VDDHYWTARKSALRDFERRWLIKMYILYHGNICKIAEAGHIPRSTVYLVMKRVNLTRDRLNALVG